MTHAPKQIWRWKLQTGWTEYSETHPITGPNCSEYHRADLSVDLVRAGYLAGVKDVQEIASDAEVFDISDAAEYLTADDEAVAAIIASVLGEPT
jgi:hypothetical protein